MSVVYKKGHKIQTYHLIHKLIVALGTKFHYETGRPTTASRSFCFKIQECHQNSIRK